MRRIAQIFTALLGTLLICGAALAQDKVVYHIDNAETQATKAAELEAASGAKVRLVSGAAGHGVTELLRESYALVRQRKDELAAEGARPADWAP